MLTVSVRLPTTPRDTPLPTPPESTGSGVRLEKGFSATYGHMGQRSGGGRQQKAPGSTPSELIPATYPLGSERAMHWRKSPRPSYQPRVELSMGHATLLKQRRPSGPKQGIIEQRQAVRQARSLSAQQIPMGTPGAEAAVQHATTVRRESPKLGVFTKKASERAASPPNNLNDSSFQLPVEDRMKVSAVLNHHPVAKPRAKRPWEKPPKGKPRCPDALMSSQLSRCISKIAKMPSSPWGGSCYYTRRPLDPTQTIRDDEGEFTAVNPRPPPPKNPYTFARSSPRFEVDDFVSPRVARVVHAKTKANSGPILCSSPIQRSPSRERPSTASARLGEEHFVPPSVARIVRSGVSPVGMSPRYSCPSAQSIKRPSTAGSRRPSRSQTPIVAGSKSRPSTARSALGDSDSGIGLDKTPPRSRTSSVGSRQCYSKSKPPWQHTDKSPRSLDRSSPKSLHSCDNSTRRSSVHNGHRSSPKILHSCDSSTRRSSVNGGHRSPFKYSSPYNGNSRRSSAPFGDKFSTYNSSPYNSNSRRSSAPDADNHVPTQETDQGTSEEPPGILHAQGEGTQHNHTDWIRPTAEASPKDFTSIKKQYEFEFDDDSNQEDYLLAEKTSPTQRLDIAAETMYGRDVTENILETERRLKQLSDDAEHAIALKLERRKYGNPEKAVTELLQESWLRSRNLGKKQVEYMEKKRLLREWFDVLDADQSGYINGDELLKPLMDSGVVTSAREFEALIAPYDKDHNGMLDYEEFVDMLCSEHDDPKTKALFTLMQMHMHGQLGNSELPFTTVIGIFSRKVVLSQVMGDSYPEQDTSMPVKDTMTYQRIHDAWLNVWKMEQGFTDSKCFKNI